MAQAGETYNTQAPSFEDELQFIECADDVPQNVRNAIDADMARFVEVELLAGPTLVAFPDGSKTYVEYYQDLFDRGSPGLATFRSIRLADTSKNGELIGYGIASLMHEPVDDYLLDRPFVDFNRTLDDFKRCGFGKRRLRIMNAACQKFMGLPLHASTLITDEAARLWQQLETEGLVIQDRGTRKFI